jgi:hypothetical protein
MKIEAVTVSVDYSEWLRRCTTNDDKLDRWVVVTHKSDLKTQELCKMHDIECVLSERVFEDAPFAKGRAINDALKILDRDAWLVHMDGDIRLPDNFQEVVKKYCSDKSKLYGSVRYADDGEQMLGQRFAVVSRGKGRSIRKFQRFDIPIGYFQMWHSSVYSEYPEESTTGKQDDWQFAMQFRGMVAGNTNLENYMSGFYMLPLKLLDVCGFQGHDRQHWMGLRNVGKVKKKKK